MKDWFLIGEFSKLTGLSLKALRLYEEKGLLVSHEKGDNGYRYFSAKQINEAKRILQFKELGFSLEQIKLLLTVTAESTLYEVVKSKVTDSKREMFDLGARIQNLESLLSSLESNSHLTEEQRGVIMESIFETSLNNLKRQGVVADAEVQNSLKSEVDELSPELQNLIPELRHILKVMKDKNIFVGPGRGSTPASLVLFSEGYSPLNPLDFGLMPETFSKSKIFMMDVEFSNSDLMGRLCDEVSKKINMEVVAFRSPILDIFKYMQNAVGEVNFDKFSDFDPMILEAPKRLGVYGLWGQIGIQTLKLSGLLRRSFKRSTTTVRNKFWRFIKTLSIKVPWTTLTPRLFETLVDWRHWINTSTERKSLLIRSSSTPRAFCYIAKTG